MAFAANNLIRPRPEYLHPIPGAEVYPDTFATYAHLVMAGASRRQLSRSLGREEWEKTITGFPLVFREGAKAASRYMAFAERQASVMFRLPDDRLNFTWVRIEDWLITPSGLEAGRSRTQKLLTKEFGEPVVDRYLTSDGKAVSTWADGELLVRLETFATDYRRTLQVFIEKVPGSATVAAMTWY